MLHPIDIEGRSDSDPLEENDRNVLAMLAEALEGLAVACRAATTVGDVIALDRMVDALPLPE